MGLYQEVRQIDEKKEWRRVQEEPSLSFYSEFKCGGAGWHIEEISSIAAEQDQRKTNGSKHLCYRHMIFHELHRD